MIPAVCATLAAALGFAVLAPPLGHRLAPTTAVRLLVPGSLAVAAATVFLLGVLAFTWIGQLPALAAAGSWSVRMLDAADPVPDPVAAASFCVLAALTLVAILGIVRRVRSLIGVYRTYVGRHPTDSLVVLDADRPDAFTTPAPAGRIVVTTGLLGSLTADERRVVLAHERAHLRHRHAWWGLAADLAAAFNPLLRRTAATVRHGLERWADEDAAATVRDRRLVARTVAHVALLTHHAPTAAAISPAAAAGDIPRRVRALLAPPPPRRPVAIAVLTGLLLTGGVATAAVQHTGDQLFEHAQAGPAAHHTISLCTAHHSHGSRSVR